MFVDELMCTARLPDLSGILTTLQIQVAATDAVIRNFALISLVCAMMSLLFGCMYIIKFGTMRKTHKAAEWAQASVIGSKRTPLKLTNPVIADD